MRTTLCFQKSSRDRDLLKCLRGRRRLRPLQQTSRRRIHKRVACAITIYGPPRKSATSLRQPVQLDCIPVTYSASRTTLRRRDQHVRCTATIPILIRSHPRHRRGRSGRVCSRSGRRKEGIEVAAATHRKNTKLASSIVTNQIVLMFLGCTPRAFYEHRSLTPVCSEFARRTPR